MCLKQLVLEVAELCGHEDMATDVFDLSTLGVKKCHRTAFDYFADCVPVNAIDRPFYQLLSIGGVRETNTEYGPSRHILPFGFVTFANEPNGDAIAVDCLNGRVHLVSHETYGSDGIHDYRIENPIPISRDSILAHSKYVSESIQAFFESWRDQLIEQEKREDEFLEAASDDPNATDEFGNTLLHHFVREGDQEMVEHEIIRGADLDHFNIERRNALHEAVVFGHARIIRFLLDQGADVNVQNNDGTTPLMLAAHYSQLKCAKILLRAGASRELLDKYGRTAFDQICVVHGTWRMKKLLKPRNDLS